MDSRRRTRVSSPLRAPFTPSGSRVAATVAIIVFLAGLPVAIVAFVAGAIPVDVLMLWVVGGGAMVAIFIGTAVLARKYNADTVPTPSGDTD
ncbi:hypothetical protein [Microbacterium oleivorans]|uniref:Uncharacterized protein n=1 Tax=Microbacterium oleivorans TaxID=273677 RepID=A0A031FXM8_9MICO|nr:hypothetical protein [Microbacterium oleivorans]EZP28390.1 hypothetical protein BW34_01370 [Microbacterium oleivorans]